MLIDGGRSGLTLEHHAVRSFPSLHRGITVAVLCLAVMTMLLGCDPESPADPVASGSASPDHRCADGNTGCFAPGSAVTYCNVLQVREAIKEGRLRVDQLPEWAERTPAADGAPMIVNFRDPDGIAGERRIDQLDAALKPQGFEFDNRKTDECVDSLGPDNYQATLEKTEGGPAAY